MSTLGDPSQAWSSCLLTGNEKQRDHSKQSVLEILHCWDVDLLARFCEDNNVNTTQVIQAAWAVVLGAYANSDEPCSKFIGSASSDGLTVYRCSLDNGVSVLAMIRGIEEQSWIPTQQSMGNESGSSLNVPFDTCLSVVLGSDDASSKCQTLGMEDSIALHVTVLVPSRVIRVNYAEFLVSEVQASRIAECLKKTLQEIISDRNNLVGDLDIISDGDRATILEWNSKEPVHHSTCIHQVFKHRAQASPEAPAIRSWDASYSYTELDNHASRLAQHLQELGVRKGTPVPFLFRKSAFAVVAVLATLKSGGVSFALNPDFPPGRLVSLINATGAELILAGADCADILDGQALKVLDIDDVLLSTLPNNPMGVVEHTSPADAALIVFTSGSTGEPKGIVFEHRQYCAYALAHHKAHYLDEKSRVLQFSSHNFDSYFADTLSTLMAGGCVCIPPEESRLVDLAGVVTSMEVTAMFMTPTLAHILKPFEVPTLKVLILGGESAVQEVVDLWADHVTLVNTYGPAECCPDAVCHNFSTGDRDSRKIGRPLQSATVWVTRPDNCKLLAPIGTVGELVIQGPTVARGYLNASKETAAAFMDNLQFHANNEWSHHWRAYRTGDLVRYAPDGSLEFIGRKDRQIKLRGQRIELGEIEHHLQAILPADTLVAVEVTSKSALVAFRTGHQFVEGHTSRKGFLLDATEEIREENARVVAELSKVLPGYMVPLIHLPVSAMPTTLSDKLDRRALQQTANGLSDTELSAYSLSNVEDEGPLTAAELALRDIWSDVLGIDAGTITKASNFIYMGGNSITAMRLAASARAHGISLLPADILRHPQLAAMAGASTSMNGQDSAQEVARPCTRMNELLQQFQPLPFPTSRIEDVAYATPYQASNVGWSQLTHRGGTNYVTWDFEMPVCASRLTVACNRLIAHHSALRTVFVVRNRQLLQVILKDVSLDVVYHCSDEGVEEATLSIIEDDLSQPIHLSKPIARFFFILHEDKVRRLILRASHSQYDGPSLNRIYADIVPAYLGGSLPPSVPLTHYMPWAAARNEGQARDFWRELLAGSTMTKVLKHSRPPTQNVLDSSVSTCIPTSVARPHAGITVATAMKAAWAAVLAEISGQTDVVFGSVNWGRTAPVSDAENIDGPCSDILPVRVRFDGDTTALALLNQVQDQYIACIAYECYGSRRIVETCTDWPPWTRFNTCVEYQNLGFEEADSLRLEGGRVDCGEIRPPADRHDIFLFITPVSDVETLVVVDFCEEVFSRGFAQGLLDRLCFYVRAFHSDVHARLQLEMESPSHLPTKQGPVARKPRGDPPDMHPQPFPFAGGIRDSPHAQSLAIDPLTGVLKRPPSHPLLQRSDQLSDQPPTVPSLVLGVWGCILGCQQEDLLHLLENDTPWFEVWGELVAAAGLAETYRRQGFKVSVEDMLEYPTISSQIALLSEQSKQFKRVTWAEHGLVKDASTQ